MVFSSCHYSIDLLFPCLSQVIKMLVLVITLFLLCWGPRLIFNVIVKMGLQGFSQITYNVRFASYLLSSIHSALNPFVYGLMSSTFRNIVFKPCAGTGTNDHTNAPSECGVSGKVIVGKQASAQCVSGATWAEIEMIPDDKHTMIPSVSHSTTDSSRAVLTTSFNKKSPSRTDALVFHVKSPVSSTSCPAGHQTHPRSFAVGSSEPSSSCQTQSTCSSRIEKQGQPVLQESSSRRPSSARSHEDEVRVLLSSPQEHTREIFGDEVRSRRTSSQATVSDTSAVDSCVSLSEPWLSS